MNPTLELKSNNNEEPLVKKLISLLIQTREFNSLFDNKEYIIKRRMMGKSGFFIRCCGSRMLKIKEVKYEKENEDNESILKCTYNFCEKCGKIYYDDGDNNF
jgi:hypothetical protein